MAGYIGLAPLSQANYDRVSFTGLTVDTISTPYSIGFIEVYKNGSLLNENQYTANNSSTIVFPSALIVTDVIDIIKFSTFSMPVGDADTLGGELPNHYVDVVNNQSIAGTKTFVESPVVPTPADGDVSGKIATTEFVSRNGVKKDFVYFMSQI